MAKVLVPLAEGCEELEAVTIIDLLRRAGIEVVTAGLQPGIVKASRGTRLMPDAVLDDVLRDDFDMIVLPGGMPGAQHLKEDPRIIGLLKKWPSRANTLPPSAPRLWCWRKPACWRASAPPAIQALSTGSRCRAWLI